jgi:hypothetical protein
MTMDNLPDVPLLLILEYAVSDNFRQIFKVCAINRKIRAYVHRWVWPKRHKCLRLTALRSRRSRIHGLFDDFRVNGTVFNGDLLTQLNGGDQLPRQRRPTEKFFEFITHVVSTGRPTEISLQQERLTQNNQTGLHHLFNHLIRLVRETEELKIDRLCLIGLPYQPSLTFPLKSLVRSCCSQRLYLAVDSLHKLDPPPQANDVYRYLILDVKYLDVTYFCISKYRYDLLFRSMPNLKRMRTVYAFASQISIPSRSPRVLIKYVIPVIEYFINCYLSQQRDVKLDIYIPVGHESANYNFVHEYLNDVILSKYRTQNLVCSLVFNEEQNHSVVFVSVAFVRVRIFCVKFNVLEDGRMINVFE